MNSPLEADGAPLDSKPQFRLIFKHARIFLKLYPRYVALFLFLSVLSIAAPMAVAVLFGHITNQVVESERRTAGTEMTASQAVTGAPSSGVGRSNAPGPSEEASLIPAYILWSCLLIGGVGIAIASRWAQTMLDFSMAATLRDHLFRAILRRKPEFFHANDAGTLTMVANEMSVETQVTLREMLLEPVVQFFAFLLAAGGIIYSFQQFLDRPGWVLWACVAAIMILALISPLGANYFGRRLRRASAGVRDQRLALAALVNGAFSSPEEIQVFRAEETFAKKHERQLDLMKKVGVRQSLVVEAVNAVSKLPTDLVSILFIGVAISLIAFGTGQASQAGFLVSILLLVPHLMMPVQSFSAYMVMADNAWPSVETVLELLDREEDRRVDPAPRGAAAPSATDLRLEARNLSFRYRPDLRLIFDDVSFEAPPGKITGLVARKGEGKTTLFRLLLRFYDPNEGRLLLGGSPTTELDPEKARERVTMMSQFPAFFHDTLRENFRVAKPEATDQEIEELCRGTGVWPILEQSVGNVEDMRRFSNPLDRPFAAGRTLSGGQKKLLALTRCLLRSPTHLLLDEPTVGMDNLEKYGLVPKLRAICSDRTVLTVDHDVAWLLEFCDYFLVLDQGRLVQQGTGEELSLSPGLFQELLLSGQPKVFRNSLKEGRPK